SRIAIGRIPVHGEEDGVADAIHGDVAYMDVFHGAAAGGSGFDVEAVAGAAGGEVGGQHVADAAGSLAADGEESPTLPGRAVPDDNILCGAVDAKTVPVAAGLQAEVVVVAVDITILYQYPGRGVDVDTVRTWSVAVFVVTDDDAVDRDIFRIEDLYGPEAGVDEFQSFDRDVFGILDEECPDPFSVIIDDPAETFWIIFLAHGPVLIPAEFSAGVDLAIAGDGGFFYTDDIEEGGGPFHFYAGDAGVDLGVVFEVLAAQEFDVLVDAELDTFFEEDRAGEVGAGFEDYDAAASGGGFIDGRLDGFGGEGAAIFCGAGDSDSSCGRRETAGADFCGPFGIGAGEGFESKYDEEDGQVSHGLKLFKVILIKPTTTSRATVLRTRWSRVLYGSRDISSTVAAPPSMAVLVSPLMVVHFCGWLLMSPVFR